MVALILGPIVGGLSPTSAHLWGRADGPGKLHAWLGRQADLRDAQLAATSLPLVASSGYAGVAPLRGLEPDSQYYYALTLDGEPPVPGSQPYPGFRTLPKDGERYSFTFAFGSCFRPEDENAGAIFEAIEERRRWDGLRFILLLGDQIYADDYGHNGIGKIACSLQEYRDVYSYTWSRPAFRRLLPNLPAFMTLDDHEVDDDWIWKNEERLIAHIPIWDRVIRFLQGRPLAERRIPLARVQDALKAFWEHQLMHAPHLLSPPVFDDQGEYTLRPEDPGSLAYAFSCGAAAFFVLDTRTMRVKNRRICRMLGEGQWEALEGWLCAVKERYPVKFVVTSASALYDLFVDFARDRWSGFRDERERLLNFVAKHEMEGVYLLAGDLHSAHAVRADLNCPGGGSVPLWEFCSTPFDQSPNRFSSRTYIPVRSKAIRTQERIFLVTEPNFGVVRVDFEEAGRPRVKFEVYGKEGELLKETGDERPELN